jgi:high-affinity nickel permease
MLGLDESIASYSDGTTMLVVLAVAVLLGLRHATDPDHLAAVTTLVAGDGARSRATRLGLAWGAGHAITLFAFGLPIVLFEAFLPERLQQGAEALIGFVIVSLAVWLLVRWRRGAFAHGEPHVAPARTPLQAFAIGLLHGVGGSAGVGVLLLATVDVQALAVASLGVLAVLTAVSMTVLSTGFGLALTSEPARRSLSVLAPVLGVASIAFGAWYALAALHVAPYYF